MMLKAEYELVDLEVISFEGQDIITLSCGQIDEDELTPVCEAENV